METKDVILRLRTAKGLSQDELAAKVFVTRQAVSRWETGETVPNTETLKLLSAFFDVSINTLLGSPRRPVCQCCGMPLDDSLLGREKNGTLNEDYCKWCYASGEFTYDNMDELIEVSVKHMAGDGFTEEEARAYMKERLPELDYWKRYKELGGGKKIAELKKKLIDEINALRIEGMPEVKALNALAGSDVDLAYPLPNGKTANFLDGNTTYLGARLEPLFGGDRFFGVLANNDFLLIATYEKDGENPELVLYKKR